MTKKELIALLDKYPDDAEIRFEQTGYGDHFKKIKLSAHPAVRVDFWVPYIVIRLDHDV